MGGGKSLQVTRIDSRQARRITAERMRIGMIVKEIAVETLGYDRSGLLVLLGKACEDLCAHASDCVGIEPRMAEREPQKLECILRIVCERDERDDQVVAIRSDREANCTVAEGRLERS